MIKSDVSPSTVRGQTLARNSNLSRRYDIALKYRKNEVFDKVHLSAFGRKSRREEMENVDIKIQRVTIAKLELVRN